MVSNMLTGLESSFAPSPLSILEGTIDGKVFVNRAHVPTCAAVMSNNLVGGRLIGRADDLEFNRDFVSLMSQRFSSDQGAEHRLYWSTVSETWDEVVFRIFGYRVFRIDRTQFYFNRRAFEALEPMRLPSSTSLTVCRIDQHLLDEHEALRNELEGLWGSSDKFLKFGGGWVAISEENRIVGRCNSVFLGGGAAELAIWIDKPLRGIGLASHLCRRYIEDCLNRNIVPNWTCDTLNKASYNLANKMGFEPKQNYFIFTSMYAPMYYEPARSN